MTQYEDIALWYPTCVLYSVKKLNVLILWDEEGNELSMLYKSIFDSHISENWHTDTNNTCTWMAKYINFFLLPFASFSHKRYVLNTNSQMFYFLDFQWHIHWHSQPDDILRQCIFSLNRTIIMYYPCLTATSAWTGGSFLVYFTIECYIFYIRINYTSTVTRMIISNVVYAKLNHFN